MPTARSLPSNLSLSSPILVVSAFAPELAPLRRALGSALASSPVVVCQPVGIGAVDAGIGASRALARHRPRLILFLGTAGAYGAVPARGAVAIARRVVLASTSVVRSEGYLPAPLVATAACDPAIRRALRRVAPADTAVVDVATTLAITRSASLARRLVAATRAGVENLEIFAVARAARAEGIPFGAVLGIANRVGPAAHAEWLRHQAAATRAATLIVERFLQAEIPNLRAPSRSAAGPRPSPRPSRPSIRR